MGKRSDHAGKTARARSKAAPALLEVWLELLEKIEGPKRRRAAELRRRRDNPIRRSPNMDSQLRACGYLRWPAVRKQVRNPARPICALLRLPLSRYLRNQEWRPGW